MTLRPVTLKAGIANRQASREMGFVIMVVGEGRQRERRVCLNKEGRRWLERVRGCGMGCWKIS